MTRWISGTARSTRIVLVMTLSKTSRNRLASTDREQPDPVTGGDGFPAPTPVESTSAMDFRHLQPRRVTHL